MLVWALRVRHGAVEMFPESRQSRKRVYEALLQDNFNIMMKGPFIFIPNAWWHRQDHDWESGMGACVQSGIPRGCLDATSRELVP